MDQESTLAQLHKKMHLEELRATLSSLWTVCPSRGSDPLDAYIEGLGSLGTFRMPQGPTGTEVRIRFGKES
jgi:hypothetical protein